MLFLKEILLFVLLLCVCWETGDTTCQIECDQSQIGLSQPTCYLKDNGTETYCRIFVDDRDAPLRTLGSFDKLTLMFDLQTLVVYLDIGNGLKVNTSKSHTGIESLTIRYGNTQFSSEIFFLLPNLKYIVYFDHFPYFSHSNNLLTYLYVSPFDIPSTASHVLTRSHVSGLTDLKYLFLHPRQFMYTTDQSFTGLTALRILYIENFNIPNLITTLSPLVRLKDLRINRCGLTDISFLTRTTFLYGLTSLNLNNNRIAQIQPGIFSSYNNLTGLYLFPNRISQLEGGSFTGLNNLLILDLDSNPIQQIGLTAFKGLESLTGLDLGKIPLTSLSSRMFEYLPGLYSIRLFQAPLHCDCSLQWLFGVHHNFGLLVYSAFCASPSEHINKLATDPSIYRDCIQDLSYQCFNRSNRCPSGSYCQDTLDTYTCVCEQEGYLFVGSLNRCVSSQEIRNGLQRLSGTIPTCTICPSCPTFAAYTVTRKPYKRPVNYCP